MKYLKLLVAAALLAGFVLPGGAYAVDQKTKPKPYTLKTCIISGDKLGADMGKPYVFVYNGREIKLCCKGCLKDFNKNPAKYVKLIEKAESKAAKAGTAAADAKTAEKN
jgi:YHS domain-containing protein